MASQWLVTGEPLPEASCVHALYGCTPNSQLPGVSDEKVINK